MAAIKGKRGFALAQVVAQILAHYGDIAGVVQYIVNDLKCGSHGLAVFGAGQFPAGLRAGQDGKACAGFEQFGGLGANDLCR